jgi:hypothetical protein
MSTSATPRKKGDFLTLGDETYVLHKVPSGVGSGKIKDRGPELLRFDGPFFKDMKTYVYDPLPTKRIRLMRLNAGDRSDSIQCELFEAAYDNSFHIPTQVSRKRKGQEMNEPDRNRKRQRTQTKEEVDMEEKKRQLRNEEDDESKKILKSEIEKLKLEILKQELVRVEEIEVEYEALSWCWGRNVSDYGISIEKGDENYKMSVRKDLALALKYLRHREKPRILWIDAICIDQANSIERNQQVQMMSRIYTRAENVCIWLGEQDDESEVAFKFIKEEITHLKDFDSISSDKDYSNKWQALMVLMQREWFSRRWVVQELSLANKADIWCGPDTMPWKEFAVAVELFVEVESATHRLSEVMQKDVQFKHVPGWFEYVSQLGASLLVQATGKVFRSYGTPMDKHEVNDESADEEMTDEKKAKKEKKAKEAAKKEKHKQREESLNDIQTIDPLDRRSLLSLEFLVTTMFIFKASECRDSVYSMLAIARDAAPFAKDVAQLITEDSFVDEEGQSSAPDESSDAEPASSANDVSFQLSLFEGFLAEKPFLVDYARPYSDVCRDFIEFCIQRKSSQDPVQALDILCRPWALDPPRGKSIRLKTNKQSTAGQDKNQPRLLTRDKNKPWEKHIGHAIINPKTLKLEMYYTKERDPDGRNMETYWKDVETQLVWRDDVRPGPWEKPKGWEKVKSLCEDARTRKKQNKMTQEELKKKGVKIKESKDIELPSWVPRAQNAPFEIYRHPGIKIKKTGRANADPLVGWPQDGHRNYSAAQTETVKLDCLKFKKRPDMGHYSLEVAGFVVGTVDEVKDVSQGGNIPNSWLELSGWEPPYNKDPPADFWRTIVADRGPDNHNPPYYYARACRESVDKGGRESGRVNTTDLINNEQNSIIAEFCRRVHAVIWGRSLFKTDENGLAKCKLGLGKNVQKGDLVCILHGCTVPVILSRRSKKEGERVQEELEDSYELFKLYVQRLEKVLMRKKRYEAQKNKHKESEQRREQHEQEEGTPRQNLWERAVQDARNIANKVLKVDRNAREEQQASEQKRKDILKPPVVNGGEAEVPKSRFKRDEDTYYVFKGESYVHGCMDGEAVRELFYQEEQERIFELR